MSPHHSVFLRGSRETTTSIGANALIYREKRRAQRSGEPLDAPEWHLGDSITGLDRNRLESGHLGADTTGG